MSETSETEPGAAKRLARCETSVDGSARSRVGSRGASLAGAPRQCGCKSPTVHVVAELQRGYEPDAKRRRATRLRAIALGLALAHALPAAEPEASWSRYFPEQPNLPSDEAGWASLAENFPNRVKPAISPASPPAATPAATRVPVKPGIEYVRVRKLASDFETIATALETARVILDLRYVHGELEPSLTLGSLLARETLMLEGAVAIKPADGKARAAGQLTLCLVNRGTSGPLEAVLDALQHAGAVLLVGTQTAGDTGIFAPVPGAPAWRVIAKDLRRESGHSLLDVGVTPGLFVETTPDTEDAAYLAFDASQPIEELLDAPVDKARYDEAQLQRRFAEARSRSGWPGDPAPTGPSSEESRAANESATIEGNSAPATEPVEVPDPSPADESPPPFDRSLQRAVATLIADTIFRDRAEVR